MARKNNYIELWRFFACYIIFSFHVHGRFKSGWIFVEFFFILTGFFTIKHLERKKEEISEIAIYPIKYTVKKFLHIVPYAAVGTLLKAITKTITCGMDIRQSIKYILYYPINLLLLNGTGIMPVGVKINENYATTYVIEINLWYLSAVFAALPVMIYILYLGRKMYLWLFTFFPLFIYGYMIMTDGTINGWHEGHLSFWMLDLRALAGMFLGGAVYLFSNWLRKWEYTRMGEIGLTIFETLSILAVVVISGMKNSKYDVLVVMLFIVFLGLIFSGRTRTAKINSKILLLLGKISLPVYCIHGAVYEIFEIWGYSMSDFRIRNVTFLIICFLAFFLYAVLNNIKEFGEQNCKKIKRFFVKTKM